MPGIERAVRVLIDHLKPRPGAAQLLQCQPGQILAQNFDPPGGRDIQRHAQAGQSGLAAAEFSYHAQAVSGLDAQINPVQGKDRFGRPEQAFPRQGEMALQAFDAQDRFARNGAVRGWPAHDPAPASAQW